METKNLKTKIMHRIWIISHLRKLTSVTAMKAYAGVLALFAIGKQVFVARVLQNSPGLTHPLDSFSFFTFAFAHTQLIVQTLCMTVLVASVWFLYDTVRQNPTYSPLI